MLFLLSAFFTRAFCLLRCKTYNMALIILCTKVYKPMSMYNAFVHKEYKQIGGQSLKYNLLFPPFLRLHFELFSIQSSPMIMSHLELILSYDNESPGADPILALHCHDGL